MNKWLGRFCIRFSVIIVCYQNDMVSCMNQTNLNIVNWSSIPTPHDDGRASHLCGMPVPAIRLKSTNGKYTDISSLSGITVIFAYPMTGRPDTTLPDGWDQIPGARGCTPQSCSFRDLYGEMKFLGMENLFGLSTQNTKYQREAVERLYLPFPMLSDLNLKLVTALNMPTMIVGEMTLLKRLTFVMNKGIIKKVFYPVFPPDRNAIEVISYLRKCRESSLG
ncbi:MAG: peroxiredoxin [Candidatus Zeuxoniibacter abyssi]|nr:MAG: peroxiredoxin [Candidatus Persebacteraceae bacterium AB1(2)]